MTRILVVGIGSMGWNHARVCSDLGVLVGICDQNKESLKQVGERFGVMGYSDLSEAINECRPDGVIIATPTSTHYDITKKVLASGLDVMVEKPLVDQVAHGEELVSIANKKDAILAVGHIERHNPVISREKKHLENGDWGDLITLSARRVSPFNGRIQDVGVILDIGIH